MEISLAGTRTGEFLLSEAGGERSRELIRLPAGRGMLAAPCSRPTIPWPPTVPMR